MKAKMESNLVSLAVIDIDIGKEVFHIVGLGVDGKIAFCSKLGVRAGILGKLMALATAGSRGN